MAHFAEIDENNVVLRVLVVADENTADENGNEVEAVGVAYLKGLFGEDTNWVQTSYNRNMRGIFASVGGTYEADTDVFIPEKPYPSWVYNYEGKHWEAPVALEGFPLDYEWNEETLSWDFTGTVDED
jgi:hypothetical protein